MEPIKETLKNLDRANYPPHIASHLEQAQNEYAPATRKDAEKALRVSSLDHTFANFVTVTGAKESLKVCQQLCSGRTSWKMLLIYGGVGNGKTYLCEAAAISLTQQGHFTKVVPYVHLIRSLKHAMHSEFLTPDEIITNVSTLEGLILDDVGSGYSDTEFSMRVLEEIIAERYYGNLLTLVTTNLDLLDLPPRVVSRFSDPTRGRIVLNRAEDYRLRRHG